MHLAGCLVFLNQTKKLLVFNSFILAHFNYCPLVWHHCGSGSTRKIEKIQERGLRLVYNDHVSSYCELMAKANKTLLYVHVDRIKKIALFVYKCLNKIGPEVVHDMYDPKDIPYHFRDSNKITQPKVNTTTKGLRSLKYNGADIWNKLPL